MANNFIRNLGNVIYQEYRNTLQHDDLKASFEEAVKKLAKGSLKTKLTLKSEKFLKKLESKIQKLSELDPDNNAESEGDSFEELTSLGGRKDVGEEEQTPKLVFSLLDKDSRVPDEEVMKDNSKDEKKRIYGIFVRRALECPGFDNKVLCAAVDRLFPLLSKVPEVKFDWYPKLNFVIQLSVGTSQQSVIKVLQMLFDNVTEDVNKCLSKDLVIRAGKLGKVLKRFLSTCHMNMACRGTKTQVGDVRYWKLMSALLSYYVDLSCLHSGKVEKKKAFGRKLCSFVSYILLPWPEAMLEVVLQSAMLEEKYSSVLLPLIGKSLSQKPEGGSHLYYLKFVLVVRRALDRLEESDQLTEWLVTARNTPAAVGFIDWLLQRCPEAEDSLPVEDKKFKKRKVTKFLLEEADSDVTDCVMNSLMSYEEEEMGDEDIHTKGLKEVEPSAKKKKKDKKKNKPSVIADKQTKSRRSLKKDTRNPVFEIVADDQTAEIEKEVVSVEDVDIVSLNDSESSDIQLCNPTDNTVSKAESDMEETGAPKKDLPTDGSEISLIESVTTEEETVLVCEVSESVKSPTMKPKKRSRGSAEVSRKKSSSSQENENVGKEADSVGNVIGSETEEEVFEKTVTTESPKVTSKKSMNVQEKFISKALRNKTPLKTGAAEKNVAQTKSMSGSVNIFSDDEKTEIEELEKIQTSRTKSTEEIHGIVEEIMQKLDEPKKISTQKKDDSLMFTDDSIVSADSEKVELDTESEQIKSADEKVSKKSSDSSDNEKIPKKRKTSKTRKSTGSGSEGEQVKSSSDKFIQSPSTGSAKKKFPKEDFSPKQGDTPNEETDKVEELSSQESEQELEKIRVSSGDDLNSSQSSTSSSTKKEMNSSRKSPSSKQSTPIKRKASEEVYEPEDKEIDKDDKIKSDSEKEVDSSNLKSPSPAKKVRTPSSERKGSAKKKTPKKEENSKPVEDVQDTIDISDQENEIITGNNITPDKLVSPVKRKSLTPAKLNSLSKKKTPLKEEAVEGDVTKSDQENEEVTAESLDAAEKDVSKSPLKTLASPLKETNVQEERTPEKSSTETRRKSSSAKKRTPSKDLIDSQLELKSVDTLLDDEVIPSSQSKSSQKKIDLRSPKLKASKLHVSDSESEVESKILPNIEKHLKDDTIEKPVDDDSESEIDKAKEASPKKTVDLKSPSLSTMEAKAYKEEEEPVEKSPPAVNRRKSLRQKPAQEKADESESEEEATTQKKPRRSSVRVVSPKRSTRIRKIESDSDATDASETSARPKRKSMAGQKMLTIKEESKVAAKAKTPVSKVTQRKLSASTTKKAATKKTEEVKTGRKRRLSLSQGDNDGNSVGGNSTDSEITFPKMKKASTLIDGATAKHTTTPSRRKSEVKPPATKPGKTADAEEDKPSRRYSLRKK